MKLALLFVTLVFMLASLPLLSFGTDQDVPALWIAGLALLSLAGLIPPALRYLITGDDQEESEE